MLVRLRGTRDGIEDLAQDVFLRLFRGLKGFRGEAQVRTYLHRIVIHVAHNARRRRSSESRRLVSLTDSPVSSETDSGMCWEDRLAHPGADAEQCSEQREFAAAVEQALARLSSPERAVLVLYHQEELSYQEIALAMTIPVNSVRTHLHRGRGKLRALLSKSRERVQL